MVNATEEFKDRLDVMSNVLATKLDRINAAKWLIDDLEYQYNYDYKLDENGEVLKDENGDSIRVKQNCDRNDLLDLMIEFLISKIK